MGRHWRDILLAVIVAGLVAAVAAWAGMDQLRTLTLSDTDDAMRLVQARDLVGGQGWSDLTQHRLDPPGVAMHWSRHLDVLVAPFLVALGPVTGGTAAAIAVPALLLAALLAVLVMWFGGTPAAGDRWLLVLVAVPMTAVASQFLPGRLDHHGLQILLTVAGAVVLLRGRWIAGGAIIGSALAVGLDALPALLGLVIALGIGWVVRPDRWGDALAQVPAAAAVAAVVGTLLMAPDGRLWSAACDVFSLPLLAALVVTAAGSLLVVRRPGTQPLGRLGRLGIVGLVSAGALAAIEPGCLTGPLADVPPEVVDAWLSMVSEARSLISLAADDPLRAAGYVLPAVVGLALAATAVRRGEDRWLPLLGMLGGATAVVLLQLRAVTLAGILALPTLALLAPWLRARMQGWPAPAASVGFIVALLTATGTLVIWAGALIGDPPAEAQQVTCGGSEALRPLGEEPPGLVLAHVDLGPAILLHTAHSVPAAPYHRNVEGILVADELLGGPSTVADLRAAGVDLVVVCPDSAANWLYLGEGSLMERLLAGEVPDGLVPASPGVVDVYRVVPAPR